MAAPSTRFLAPPTLPADLAAALPFSRRVFVPSRGAFAGEPMHFIDHGPRDGRVVFLGHGNPTWSFLWRKVIAALPPDLRVVVPDAYGLGLSAKPREVARYTLDDQAVAYAELIEALDLRDIVLGGQDWGGPFVVGAGARVPERVAAVLLANTAVLQPRRPRGTLFHRFSRVPVVSDAVFRGLGFPQVLLEMAQGDRRLFAGSVRRAYRWPMRRLADRTAPLALARMVPDGPEHPSVAALGRGDAWLRAFAGPMTLVWGMRDPILAGALRKHEAAFPQARVVRTEAGHFLQEQVPEVLARELLALVDQTNPTD
jgi:haloalkane dehalogenase